MSVMGIRRGWDGLLAFNTDDPDSQAHHIMDNDVTGTDYFIGFSTAITRSVNSIHALRTSSGYHERMSVVELFGRYCGETSLISGSSSSPCSISCAAGLPIRWT
jgi:6-phosphofructokinase